MRLAFTPSSPDYLIVVPDYHPAYGLDDTTRAEVLRLVRVEGVSVKEAAAQFNVGQSTVYKWLSHLKGL
jgi:DNA-binding transcriptional ArsR family regulator